MNAFKTIFFVFLILCFIQLLVFSGKIFYLGYKSYQLDCNIIEPNETNPGGYFNQADCTINIISYQDEKELDKIISHESCHQKLFSEGKHKNCSQPIGLFFEEVRCYLSEYF